MCRITVFSSGCEPVSHNETGRKYGDPAHAIASGNDLIMPGSSGTVEDVYKRQVFVHVLEDAGVYKCTEKGREAFLRFVKTL